MNIKNLKKYAPIVVAAVVAVLNVLLGANAFHVAPHVADTVNGILALLFGASVHVNL